MRFLSEFFLILPWVLMDRKELFRKAVDAALAGNRTDLYFMLRARRFEQKIVPAILAVAKFSLERSKEQ